MRASTGKTTGEEPLSFARKRKWAAGKDLQSCAGTKRGREKKIEGFEQILKLGFKAILTTKLLFDLNNFSSI
jgi:hypothetical protein